MTDYITHTALESRKVNAAMLKKYGAGGDTFEQHVQQYLVQMKFDGCCGVMIVENGFITLFTRTGEPVANFPHIQDAFNSLPVDQMMDMVHKAEDDAASFFDDVEFVGKQDMWLNGVYFGEFWNEDFAATTIGGLLNLVDLSKIIEKRSVIEDVQFVVNDFVTLDEWAAGKSDLGFEERIQRIRWMNFIGNPQNDPSAPPSASIPPVWFCGHEGPVADQEAVSLSALAEEAKAAGRHDGIILRDPRGTWQKGARTLACVKVKPTLTVDVKVVDYELGKGKYAGVIGKVHFEYKGKVGKTSGMTDELRGVGYDGWVGDFFGKNWLGKVIEVEAMEESLHGVLREPRFKRFREGADASEVDA